MRAEAELKAEIETLWSRPQLTGPLIERSTATLMQTTDYSPVFDAAKAARPRDIGAPRHPRAFT